MRVAVATGLRSEVLAWDTEFWGVRQGRAYSPNVDEWAHQNAVGCVSLLVGADDVAGAHRAEQNGFRLMDVRVTLGRRTAPEAALVREVRSGDVKRLAGIARVSHRITRFYADPRFDDSRCDDLYENWVRSSVDGWADKVLVAGDADGYVTVHVNDGVGSIGLIAVDEACRRRGHGERLVLGAVGWCHGQGVEGITVVTQGRNVGAQRLFQKCGFRTMSTELWFHKWYRAG